MSGVRVAVVGAHGFVGSAVVDAARQHGIEVRPVSGHRARSRDVRRTALTAYQDVVDALAQDLARCDVVVNCAGSPDSTSTDTQQLHLANAVFPGLVARAAGAAGLRRMVHVSSAVVQGRLPLDASRTYDAISPYGRSKVDGEAVVLGLDELPTVVYRPPSVHSARSRITRALCSWGARGRLVVEAPGTAPTPQALLCNVASAVVELARHGDDPPEIVAHPWEGTTVRSLVEVLGGRRVRTVPPALAGAAVGLGYGIARLDPRLVPQVRRVDLLLRGQEQVPGWLSDIGWRPPLDLGHWAELGRATREAIRAEA